MTQMEVIKKLATNVQVRFFWHLDAHQFKLAGRWLYYGLYQMLVLTSGGFLLTGGVSARRLGGFRIDYQMMGLIDVELTRACGFCHPDQKSCPYHYGLRGYVDLAVRVMRVC